MRNYILVRSPLNLVKDGLAGYGWSRVNFSACASVEELMASFKQLNLEVGRRKKAIMRFYNIKQDDVVIVPMNRAFAIGIATNKKLYAPEVKNGANQIQLEYLKDSKGQLAIIPRKEISEALSTRLKVRPAVVNILEFKDEIELLIQQIAEKGYVSYSSRIDDQEAEAVAAFKKQLLANMRAGKTNLESGGYGLEKLVLELLKLEGYSGKIAAKNAHEGIADVDIDAYSNGLFKAAKLQIQVKHHKGNTSKHGLKQLIAVDNAINNENIGKDDFQDTVDSDESDNDELVTEKWLITTGELSADVKEFAKDNRIKVMDGTELVDWIYSKQTELSLTTRQKLGISSIPTLLT
jgi:restriction system protein